MLPPVRHTQVAIIEEKDKYLESHMIDIGNAELLTPQQVCKLFPGRKGKGLSRSTVMRWMLTGIRGHKLESVLAVGQRLTTREAVGGFLAAINGVRGNHAQPVGTRHQQQVDRQLAAEGF